MNRVKKEFRRKGIKLECDYMEMPHFIKGRSIFEPGYIFIDGITVDSETATVKVYLNVIVETYKLLRNGDIERNWLE